MIEFPCGGPAPEDKWQMDSISTIARNKRALNHTEYHTDLSKGLRALPFQELGFKVLW